MAIRAFVIPLVVLIDDQEAIKNETRSEEAGPASLEEVKQYLTDTVSIDWSAEDGGDDIGMQSLNLHFEEAKELSPEETEKVVQN